MDVLDVNAEDVRFLQASRHGEVMTPAELIEGHSEHRGHETAERVMERLRQGESLGIAMIRADVDELTRRRARRARVDAELAVDESLAAISHDRKGAGFFDVKQTLVVRGIDVLGHSHVAFAQFLGSTVLSAILDTNIVADFASRGSHGLGGCWTHVGCAQSVVAYAFIQRDVDQRYTPVRWIKEMTPVILQTRC